MVCGLDILTHPGIDVVIALNLVAGVDLALAIAIKGRLHADLAREAKGHSEIVNVLLVLEMIEDDLRFLQRVAGFGMHPAAAFQLVDAKVNLIAMRPGIAFAVITDNSWHKVELDVRPFKPGAGANEAGGFEMIGGAQARLE